MFVNWMVKYAIISGIQIQCWVVYFYFVTDFHIVLNFGKVQIKCNGLVAAMIGKKCPVFLAEQAYSSFFQLFILL